MSGARPENFFSSTSNLNNPRALALYQNCIHDSRGFPYPAVRYTPSKSSRFPPRCSTSTARSSISASRSDGASFCIHLRARSPFLTSIGLPIIVSTSSGTMMVVTSPSPAPSVSFPPLPLPTPGSCSSSSSGIHFAMISAIFSHAFGHRFSLSIDLRAISAISVAASEVDSSILAKAGMGNPHIAR